MSNTVKITSARTQLYNFAPIDNEIVWDYGLTPGALALYVVLAVEIKNYAEIERTQAQLGHLAGMTRQTVAKKLQELVEKELIAIHKPEDPMETCTYELLDVRKRPRKGKEPTEPVLKNLTREAGDPVSKNLTRPVLKNLTDSNTGDSIDSGDSSAKTDQNPSRAPTRAGAHGATPSPASSNDPQPDGLGAASEIEPPPRRGTKTSPRPPSKPARPRNLRFEAVAYYGWQINPGGPYGKQTSARIGKALKEVDESFAPPLEACDIANAYVHSIRTGNIPARDPVAIVAMIHAWIKEGKRDYNPNHRPADEPRDPAPAPGRSPADAYRRAGQPVPEGLDDA